MVDFSPQEKRLEEEDLEELLDNVETPKKAVEERKEAQEAPDQDLLDIIEKYQGTLAEPEEGISYTTAENNLYLSGSEAKESYTYDPSGEESEVVVDETPSLVTQYDTNPEDWDLDGEHAFAPDPHLQLQ